MRWEDCLAGVRWRLCLTSSTNCTAVGFPSASSLLFVSCCSLARLLTLCFLLLFPSRPLPDWPVTVLRLSSVTRHCWPAESSGVNSTDRFVSTCAAMTASCRPAAGACHLDSNRYPRGSLHTHATKHTNFFI